MVHVEWVKCTTEEKRAQVTMVVVSQECSAGNSGSDEANTTACAILACLRTIAKNFLNKLDRYGVHSWVQVQALVTQSLLLQQYGIARLRKEFIDFTDMSALEERLLRSESSVAAEAFILPVCELQGAQLVIREMAMHDVDHIIMYIDALVATKAAPKLEYKPVLNPSFPVFSTADNKALDFAHAQVAWNESLPCANIAFIGNVNSGKSSISGKLLSSLQIVPDAAIARLGREAVKLGLSESLQHAWVMDRTPHERSGGLTINSTYAGFQTPQRRYTIIDNPGHKDYCRNAAFGVFEADSVVLVMSATLVSELESGAAAVAATGPAQNASSDAAAAAAALQSAAITNNPNNQAEEQLVTAFCFGVRELVVAVNKMDLVNYSQQAFEAMRNYALKLLKKAGFKADSAVFVPISVLQGEGFTSVSDKMSGWYQGPCLLQALDELPLPKRLPDKPLRMVVDQVYHLGSKRSGGGNKAVVCGRVERGAITLRDEVSLYPNGPQRAKVHSIQLHGTNITHALAGDNVGVQVEWSKGSIGTAISATSAPAAPAAGGERRSSGGNASAFVSAADKGPAKNHKVGGGSGGNGIKPATAPSPAEAVVVRIQPPCKGMVLTLSHLPAVTRVSGAFEAQLLVMRGSKAFKCGYKPAITTHMLTVSVQVTRLVEIIGRNNTVQESNPVEVKAGQTVVCEMVALRPFAAETIHDMPRLSRFLIKENRTITAIGFIRRIMN